MKKKIASILFASILALSMTACGGGNDSTGGSSGGGESGNTGTISKQPLTLENFNADYYPVSSEIKQMNGTIDVVIQFESTEPAWQALADEYQRLHSDAVTVNIGIEGIQSNYRDKLTTELNSGKTDWDVVQGNLVNDLSAKCVNMAGAINKKNAYAGNVSWKKVLTENAYKTDASGSSSVYIINSQNLQTAWFVNTVAFNAAQAEATKEGVTLKQTPETWDELMLVCEYMKKAGYKYPLGISLHEDSINGYQFSWLLRVYGDYYYRNEYDIINDDATYKVDVTSESPESDIKYGVSPTKFFNVILDQTSQYYRGAKSDKYKEFVSQLVKMKDYLHVSASSLTFENMRSKFRTQSDGKDSPQIMLDYAGSGLSFNDIDGTFVSDFFDYPYMVSDGGYIKDGTLMRDVGGNGGYLSIVNHNSAQNELNLDFIKFVMSPYGQTIYYGALSKTDVAPQGITTVKNDLVVVPARWADFFNTSKISFTGLSDNNEFVKSFMRYINSDSGNIKTSITIWQGLLGNGNVSVDQFADKWNESLMKAWSKYANAQGWKEDCYKTWGGDTN